MNSISQKIIKIQMTLDRPDLIEKLAIQHRWIAEDQKIKSLVVAGEGNMNRVFRATLDNGSSLIFKQSLDHVAKYPEIPAPIDRIDTEAKFYEIISSDKALNQSVPRIVGFDRTQKILCLEDLGKAPDFSFIYRDSESTSKGHLEELLVWLAKLHALKIDASTQKSISNDAMRKLNHEHIFDIPLRKENGLIFSQELTEVSSKFSNDKNLLICVKKLGEKYLGRAQTTNNSLLQGDFYPGSWMKTAQNKILVIDPEFGFYGPREFDLGVFIAHLRLGNLDHTTIWSMIEKSYLGKVEVSETLVNQFTGVEIIRRVLGVAQLPLLLTDKQKIILLEEARNLMGNT